MGIFDTPADDALGEELPEGIEHAPVVPGSMDTEEPIAAPERITSPNIEAAREIAGNVETPAIEDVVAAEFTENSIPVAIVNMLHEREVGPIDPNFRWGEHDYEPFVQKWAPPAHLREQFLDYVTEARSEEHANALARKFLGSVENQKVLADATLGQRALTLGSSIVLDPTAIMGGQALTALRGVRATALGVGALTVAEQTMLSLNSPTQDESDVAIAGAVGVIGGAIIGKLTGGLPGVFDDASDAVSRITREGAAYGNEAPRAVTKTVAEPSTGQVAAMGRQDAEELAQDFAGGVSARLEGAVDEPVEAAAEAESRVANLEAIAEEVASEGGIVPRAAGPIGLLRAIPGLATIQDRGLRSKSPLIRAITQRTMLDDVGNYQANGRITQVDQQMNEAIILTDAMMEFEPAAKAWARAAGRRYNADAIDEFSDAVGTAMRRGGSSNPEVNRMVLKAREGYTRALAMGKRAGTFSEDVKDSDVYLSRIWNGEKITKAVADHGEKNVRKLLTAALRSGLAKAGVKMEEKLLKRLADGFFTRIRNRADGVDTDTAVGLRLDNVAKLDEILTDMDIPRADIDAMKLQLKNTSIGEGKIAPGKRRVQLDETAGIATSRGGLTIEDLLENDIRKILPQYARRVGADVAFREGLGVPATEAGIKRIRDQVKLAGDEVGENFADDFENVLREQASLMRGGHTPDGLWPRVGQGVRNFSFMTFGWMFGTASLAEFGAVVGKLGVIKTLQVLPELKRVRRLAETGRLENEFVDHVIGYTGLGMDSAIRPSARRGVRFDAVRDDFVNANTGLERALEAGRNITAKYSGLQGLTEWQRRQVPILVLSEIERVMMRGGKMSRSMSHRMAQMGYDEKSLKKLFDDLNKHGVEVSNHGRNIRRADMEQWAQADPDSHAQFMRALLREADRTIIDVSVGKTPAWMSSQWGKIFGQFLSFTVHSYNTHLLRGAAIRDHQVMMNFLTSSLIASTVGVGINYARFSNDPAKLKKQLTVENMAKWGVARSTFGGIPSMGVDSALGLFGKDGFFNARHSNLDSQLFSLDSTPSISLLNRVGDVGKRVLQQVQPGGKPMTGDDVKSVLRLTPLTVLPSAVKALSEGSADLLSLPRKDPRK
jgi:hypothetical protein